MKITQAGKNQPKLKTTEKNTKYYFDIFCKRKLFFFTRIS